MSRANYKDSNDNPSLLYNAKSSENLDQPHDNHKY